MDIPSHLKKAIVITICLTLTLVIAWEMYWRAQDHPISYNDDHAMWASERSKVEDADAGQTVIIGSSRIKFDLDLPVYEKESQSKPIQLALEGTNPLPVLHDVANNTGFSGTLLIGITDGLFFSKSPRATKEVDERIKYYSRWTPAQRASFGVSRTLESQFVFLDQEKFSLNPLLKRLPIPNREGVWMFPNFPLTFAYSDIQRQTKMTEMFVSDTSEHRKMKTVWAQLGLLSRKRGIGGDTLTAVLESIKKSTDKIISRGGQVYFIRCPSTGPIWEAEQISHPRKLFYDALLQYTGCPGVHFMDHPELSRYDCPEWSHLTPTDAKTFTKDLVSIIKKEKASTSSLN